MLDNPYLKDQGREKKMQKKSMIAGRKSTKAILSGDQIDPAVEKPKKKHKSKKVLDEE